MDPSIAARRLLEEIGAPDEDEDVVLLALRKLDIELVEDEADSIDAMLIHVPPGKPIIAVNSSRPLCRRRFSIAHEIGHYLLGHNSLSFSGSGGGMIKCESRQERAANAFAAEFLMPKKLLAREAHKYSLRALARRYLVSMQAMEIRLKELGLV
ncbi:MAG TPA: ImmA/IrrE family metallo-endopeptidase, partial [Thermosynergistes sp.]|nr:ImmA/IrrE family metallo-endopeptidase [Thermosynergistes sp.]